MSRLLSIVLVGLLLSCSILEDSDITSLDELKKLKLKGIEITQVLNSGTLSQGMPVQDSVLDISFYLGKLTKQTKIQWHEVQSSYKLKFRSGVTSNIIIKNRYFEDGKIRSCWVYSGGTIREQYYFRYNSKGRLVTLSTTVLETGQTLPYSTYDTLIYQDAGFDWYAIRSSKDASRRVLFGGDLLSNEVCLFVGPIYFTDASITDKQYNYCDKDNFYIYPGGESADFYAIGDDLLEEVYIGNRRKDSDRNCCGDQYYFHPILLIPADYRLRIMYALDWWEVKNSTNPSGDKDQSVRLKFYYE